MSDFRAELDALKGPVAQPSCNCGSWQFHAISCALHPCEETASYRIAKLTDLCERVMAESEGLREHMRKMVEESERLAQDRIDRNATIVRLGKLLDKIIREDHYHCEAALRLPEWCPCGKTQRDRRIEYERAKADRDVPRAT